MQGFGAGAWSGREAIGVWRRGLRVSTLQAILQTRSKLSGVKQRKASVHDLEKNFDQVEREAATIVRICSEKQTRETEIEA